MAKDFDFTFQLILVAALGAFLYYLFMQNSSRFASYFPNAGALTMQENFECPSEFTELPKSDKVYHPIEGEIPVDEADMWAQANPSGEGALQNKNFLDSGYMASQIEMVGQNKVTMNTGLRSEPIVPQYGRSVWRPDLFKPDDMEYRIMNGTGTC